MNLFITAYPAQLPTFQLEENNKIISSKNCNYSDIVHTTAEYLNKNNISNIFILGSSIYAERINQQLYDNFHNQVHVERVEE